MSIGQRVESLAKRFLKKRCWRIVTTNLRVDRDEVDVLALSPAGDILAMIEVRTTGNIENDPRSTVGDHKRRCVLIASKQMDPLASLHRCALRIDLITVNLAQSSPKIRHYEDQIAISRN